MKLIGLIGKAGVGKDTAADFLSLDHQYSKYAFAEPLYAMVNALITPHPGAWQDRKWKESPIPWIGKSPRQLLQTLGTEWGREMIHPDLWTNAAGRRLRAVMDFGMATGMVVSDVRFHNEADWILENGGVLVEITRPNVQGVQPHISENAEWTTYPRFVVANNSSIAAFRKELNLLTESINRHREGQPA